MNQILEVLKSKQYQMPQILLFNYHKLGINELELIIIMYILNDTDSNYNPKKISTDLDIPVKKILEVINTLVEKGILSIEIIKVNSIRNEVINLDLMYEKLAFLIMKKDTNKKDTNLFDIYAKELGRDLSPTEYEIINSWLDGGYTEELILLALKEAIYNGTTNFRYIDRIIFEWAKKGIKNKEDVEKNRKAFKKSKENKELFDYDWLNDTEDN